MLEMLLVITLLSLMVTFMAATVYAAVRVHQADALLYHNLRKHNSLAERFRDDVANAIAAPTDLGILRSNPSCLILQFTDGKHVIYHAGDTSLERIELNEAFEPTSAMALYDYAGRKEIQFSRTDDGRLLTLRLRDIEPRFNHKHDIDIMAALGGNLQ